MYDSRNYFIYCYRVAAWDKFGTHTTSRRGKKKRDTFRVETWEKFGTQQVGEGRKQILLCPILATKTKARTATRDGEGRKESANSNDPESELRVGWARVDGRRRKGLYLSHDKNED